MKNFTITAMTLLAFVATAAAGDDKAAEKKKAAPDPKADPKAAQVKAPEPAPAPAPAPPAQPDPPAEMAAAIKAMRGTWKCSGDMSRDDGTTYKSKFTVRVAADLDKFWIRADFAQAKSKDAPYPYKFTAYKTYSTADSKWHQVMVDNWGGISTGWSTGPDAAAKIVWEMDTTMMGKAVKFRDYEEPGAKKGTIHMWGEITDDGGKSWNKVYDTICRK